MAGTDAVAGSVPTSGTTPLPAGSSSSSSNSGATLAGNFQTFLTLLTTQLQNQNPESPLDTNQFTQELVQFASVEQQLKTNDQLASLVSLQQTAQATQSLGFVGKTAVVPGNTASLSNSQAIWSLNVPANGKMTVTIANAQGQNVFTGDYTVTAGNNQPFVWNGKGTDGTQWQDGQYTLTATATDGSGNSQAIATSIAGVVSSVDLTQTPPLLTIDGQSFTVNQIQRIVN
jgi:flagellar basal-body rod modification protein FlgD